jgi:hypothetical protein
MRPLRTSIGSCSGSGFDREQFASLMDAIGAGLVGSKLVRTMA